MTDANGLNINRNEVHGESSLALLPASMPAMIDTSPNPAAPPDVASLSDKFCSRSEALARVAQLPRPVVFTNGVFDVMHRGHVVYLAQARALGGSLVVALNTDASARRLGKGTDRPLNNEVDRAYVMAALASVSLVTWFDEDTPTELITELRPDLLVKGGDYDMSKLQETRVVEAYGGRALAIPFVDGYSTTALVNKIRAAS
jgi:rfaE bifunctional protein nucleotidyltransferase chain/domain